MLDVHLPTTGDKQLVLIRYTQPEKEHEMLKNRRYGWKRTPHSVERRLLEGPPYTPRQVGP